MITCARCGHAAPGKVAGRLWSACGGRDGDELLCPVCAGEGAWMPDVLGEVEAHAANCAEYEQENPSDFADGEDLSGELEELASFLGCGRDRMVGGDVERVFRAARATALEALRRRHAPEAAE